MLGYLFRYLVARTTYDVVCGHAVRTAEQRSLVAHANALGELERERRRNYVAPIDDNMVIAGRRNAPLGSSERAVESCYGPRLSDPCSSSHGSSSSCL